VVFSTLEDHSGNDGDDLSQASGPGCDRLSRTYICCEEFVSNHTLLCFPGWKTTVQNLIDRFEELGMSPPTPPTVEGDAATGEEESIMDEATAAHHKALTAATRSMSGQEAQLSKLRIHFQKVPSNCIRRLKARGGNECS
jgi:hypothetical protein